MGLSRIWQKLVGKKLYESTQVDTDHLVVLPVHVPVAVHLKNPPNPIVMMKTEEFIAATKIQAVFRAHLARQAFKALKSLVKLQALARGLYVRKQLQIAMKCMHLLVRIQVRIRARQLLHVD